MKEIILVKYGEIILKGLNRSKFEDLLIRNIKKALGKENIASIKKAQAVIYIDPAPHTDADTLVEKLRRVFGIIFIAKAGVFPKDMDVILSEGADYVCESLYGVNTFKVEAKRSDKKFPLGSPEISREMGGAILSRMHKLKVQVQNPEVIVRVEIRDSEAYVYSTGARSAGPGGMPTGPAERLLFSFRAVSTALLLHG